MNTEFEENAARKQNKYVQHRAEWRRMWWVSETEEFCVRKEVDPNSGKWLKDIEQKS